MVVWSKALAGIMIVYSILLFGKEVVQMTRGLSEYFKRGAGNYTDLMGISVTFGTSVYFAYLSSTSTDVLKEAEKSVPLINCILAVILITWFQVRSCSRQHYLLLHFCFFQLRINWESITTFIFSISDRKQNARSFLTRGFFADSVEWLAKILS